MRRWFRLALSALALGFSTLSLTTIAHADTLVAGVYTLNNAYVSGYSVTGTVTLTASATASAVNLTFNDPNVFNPGAPNFTAVSSTAAYNGLSQNYFTGSGGGTGQIALYFNTALDPNGFLNLCLGNAQCGTSSGTTGASTLQIYGFYNGTSNPGLNTTNFSSGYLTRAGATSTAVTPELSSLLLLGTAILAAPILLRRRFRSV